MENDAILVPSLAMPPANAMRVIAPPRTLRHRRVFKCGSGAALQIGASSVPLCQTQCCQHDIYSIDTGGLAEWQQEAVVEIRISLLLGSQSQ